MTILNVQHVVGDIVTCVYLLRQQIPMVNEFQLIHKLIKLHDSCRPMAEGKSH